jgi:hypothetical protein
VAPNGVLCVIIGEGGVITTLLSSVIQANMIQSAFLLVVVMVTLSRTHYKTGRDAFKGLTTVHILLNAARINQLVGPERQRKFS